MLDSAYNEAVHWKNNLFKIPQGSAGKSFTAELSHLFSAFANGSALEQIALKAATVLPLLMLQKPCRSSKTIVNILDVRVFNPHAPSNKNSSISNCYNKHENEKKRAYEQRIRNIEHSSFTLLVLSAMGGMAKQSTTFYKRLASLLADKWEQPYSSTLYWLRIRLSFSLLRSAIQCIRGARSSRGHAEKSPLPIAVGRQVCNKSNIL